MKNRNKLFDLIKEIFIKEDPVMLLEQGAPNDEYDTEVSIIASKITAQSTINDIKKIIEEVINDRFGEDTAVKLESYLKIAEFIYKKGVLLNLVKF